MQAFGSVEYAEGEVDDCILEVSKVFHRAAEKYLGR